MAERPDPYIKYRPGDMITAESTNEEQVQIKEDILGKVGQVQKNLDDYKLLPVDAARFGGKLPEEWTKYYDGRYVLKSELKEGLGLYRRYFKTLDRPGLEPATINHDLGRFPIVEVSELLPLDRGGLTNDEVESNTLASNYRFLVYYATATDRASSKLVTRSNDKVFWGDPLPFIMEQFGKTPTDKQRFSDILNDLWGAMFDPGDDQDRFDNIKFGFSRYVEEHIIHDRLTYADLRENGMWEDLRVAMRPRLVSPLGGELQRVGDDFALPLPVNVYHINQHILEIEVSRAADLMVVLRT